MNPTSNGILKDYRMEVITKKEVLNSINIIIFEKSLLSMSDQNMSTTLG